MTLIYASFSTRYMFKCKINRKKKKREEKKPSTYILLFFNVCQLLDESGVAAELKNSQQGH
jgi:hypothetical protein